MQDNNQQFKKMIETPIPKLVIALGIPTTISMLVTNIYNMADAFFVGHLGTSASGATGVALGYMAILQAFGFMFGQGAGSLISRKLGQKDTKSAGIYASISFISAILTGCVIAGFSMLFIDQLILVLGSTDTILIYAKDYLFYIILAAPFIISSFVMNNILRFEGKASLAMVGLVSGAVLNILADPILIFIFDMGIAGAGLATALSQFVSFCILLCIFLCGKTQSKLQFSYMKPNLSRFWEIVSTGFPSMLRQGLNSISTMLLNRCAAPYGDAAIAAMSIAGRVNFFFFAIGLGMGQGFQPVCGYNYGAGKYSRVRKAFRFTLILAEISLGVLGTVGFLFAPIIVSWFRNDPAVIEVGKNALRFMCVALLFQPLNVMSNMTFQSCGHRLNASITSVLRSGLYFIPVLLILSEIFGVLGIEMAQAAADMLAFVTTLPMILWFFRKMPEDRE